MWARPTWSKFQSLQQPDARRTVWLGGCWICPLLIFQSLWRCSAPACVVYDGVGKKDRPPICLFYNEINTCGNSKLFFSNKRRKEKRKKRWEYEGRNPIDWRRSSYFHFHPAAPRCVSSARTLLLTSPSSSSSSSFGKTRLIRRRAVAKGKLMMSLSSSTRATASIRPPLFNKFSLRSPDFLLLLLLSFYSHDSLLEQVTFPGLPRKLISH